MFTNSFLSPGMQAFIDYAKCMYKLHHINPAVLAEIIKRIDMRGLLDEKKPVHTVMRPPAQHVVNRSVWSILDAEIVMLGPRFNPYAMWALVDPKKLEQYGYNAPIRGLEFEEWK